VARPVPKEIQLAQIVNENESGTDDETLKEKELEQSQ
jgi:hypothetical protein